VRLMISGSAPISVDVIDFLKICFCVPIVEGYGLSETSGGSCMSHSNDPRSGHVGGPAANTKIKLKDIPEMNYYHTDKPYPRGEICIKGASVADGYFKNPEKTAETFKDGWMHTGDVGLVLENGGFRIIDRAKNIFKLS